MRYELRVTAFDMLDQIHITTTLWRSSDTLGEHPRPVLQTTETVQGTGQPDPRHWAIHALATALESL
jgi:hypothetical protein